MIDLVFARKEAIDGDTAQTGLGIATKRNMVIAEELADVLGAAIAGTRGAVESGWLTHDQQVGQSGTKVYAGLM